MGRNYIIAPLKENYGSACDEQEVGFLSIFSWCVSLFLKKIISCFQTFHAALHGPLNVFSESQKGFSGFITKKQPSKNKKQKKNKVVETTK